MARSPDELSELAWGYVDSALSSGCITVTGPDGAVTHNLTVDQLMDVIKWMTAVKLKQKHSVDSPEDFIPPNTMGDDDAP